MLKIKRAILSVSDKTGIVELAKALEKFGVEIISTGGTLSLLKKHKVHALPISFYTGFPEILEGRVKTLHPKIHGGLLYLREKKSQSKEAAEHGILAIDLVVVNLYPFEEVTRQNKVTLARALEQIDIGGPTLLRSAAKNFKSVAVLSGPSNYSSFIEEMKKNRGKICDETLYYLARKVFQLTALYDSVISQYLSVGEEKDVFPAILQFQFKKSSPLRYGENPHQQAALYDEIGCEPAFSIKKLHGKELSYNNLVDLESAYDVVEEFEQPAAAVIKHNTPCGIATARFLHEAVAGAIDCDPESGFGGIVGLNQACDLKTAETILNKLSFLEVICSPSFHEKALELLRARKNLRLVEISKQREVPLSYRFSKLGLLAQETDASLKNKWPELRKKIQQVTSEKPSPQDLQELFFAWRCVKAVKSNGIVLSKKSMTVGIGAGQMSRVDAVKIACSKAGENARGSYLASDGFFPMADSIDVAASFGVRAMVQPGGSIRDQEVIEAANRHGIAMIFTGTRHFRH